jgi:hypothetical protein
LNVTQHARTTEFKRKDQVIGYTTDIHDKHIAIDDATVRLNGIYTIRELEGMAAMFQKLREAGFRVNCDCCRYYVYGGNNPEPESK